MSLPNDPVIIEHLWPVVTIVAAVAGVLITLIGGLWVGFKWLHGQIRDEFHGLTRSEDFKVVVSSIILSATSGWNEQNNRQHEAHRTAIAELKRMLQRFHSEMEEATRQVREIEHRIEHMEVQFSKYVAIPTNWRPDNG